MKLVSYLFVVLGLFVALAAHSGKAVAQVGPTPVPSAGPLYGTVVATGATQARTLPAYFADDYHNADWQVCDGMSDVTAAIQAEVLAGAGVTSVGQEGTGVANVHIDPGLGDCIYSSDIIVPSHSRVIIDGYMLQKAGTETNAFHVEGSSTDVSFTGHGTIDGNGANETSAASFNQGIITASTTDHIWVGPGLHFVNTRNSAINLATCSYCYMYADSVSYTTANIGHAVVFSAGSNNCWADLMNIEGVGIDGGFAFYGGVYKCGVSNSISANNLVNGFSVDDDSALPNQTHDITFANDIAYGNSIYGYTVGAAPPGVAETRIMFIGDTSYQNNYGGYHIEAGTNIGIYDQFTHDDIGPSAYCVNVDSNEQTVSYVDIDGGQCGDEGTGGTAGIGVQVNSPSSAVNVHNLHIFDDGAGVMKYGITGTFDGISGVSENLITGMATAALSFATASGTAEWQYDSNGHYVTNQSIVATNGFYAGANVTTADIFGSNDIVMQQGNPINFAYSGTPTWSMFQNSGGNLQIGPLTTGSGSFVLDTNGISNGATFTVNSAGIIGTALNTWADNHTCTAGQVAWDASYIYVCTATNTVKRAALSTF